MRASRPVGLWLVVLVATVVAACGGGEVVQPETGVAISAVDGPPVWPVGAKLTVESASTSAVVLRWPRPTENGLAPIFKVRRDGPSWVADTSDTPVYLNDGAYRYAATQGLSPCTPKKYRVELWYLDALGTEQNTGTFLETVAYPMAPLAPSAMPGPLDPVAHDFYESTRWLYEPTGAVQSGFSVTVDAAWKSATGVVRGAVRTRSGSALGCAAVSVVDHPEYGATTTREDGTFWLAVQGGQVLTVKISLPGYYQVFRTIESRNHAYIWTNEARLTPIEGTATTVSPASATVLFTGPTETDTDGTRTARLLFLPGTTAQVEGEGSPRTSFAIRAKEYTVGKTTTGGDSALAAMPADLPPTTGFTWAAELSLDGLEDKRVTFNRPVWLYLDNFIGLPQLNDAERVVVPVGSWDATKGAWVPETNGYVAKVLSVSGGVAQVDLNGDGVADTVTSPDGDADHLAPGEAAQIATIYTTGKLFWRMPRTHFSPVDANLATAADATSPNPKLAVEGVADPNCTGGSVIECENRTLGEEVPVSGTPFALKYSSARQPGRRQVFRITMPRPLRDGSPHPDHVCTEVRFNLAGHYVMNRCTRGWTDPGTGAVTEGIGESLTLLGIDKDATTITARVSWDGRDRAGRPVLGTAFGVAQIGFAFRADYASSASFGGKPVKRISGSMAIADGDRFLTFMWTKVLLQAHSWNDSVDELGQWSLDAHHWFDPAGYALHYGGGHSTGATVPIDNVLDAVSSPAYYPAYSLAFRKDGAAIVLSTPATGQLLQYKDGTYTPIGIATYPTTIAMTPDGDLLVTKAGGDFCGRVDRWRPQPGPQPPGYPKCVANCPPAGSPCYTTDPADGDAKKLPLQFPNAIAVAPDGTIFIADEGTGALPGRIFRIDPAGKGSTFQTAPNARGVAVGPDGTVYWSEGGGVIYKQGPASLTKTQIARDAPLLSFTEGGDASWTRFQAWSMAVDSAGYLTFSDVANHRVRRLVDGKLYTVAGNGTAGPSTSGAAATRTPIDTPQDLVFGGDGSLYVVAAVAGANGGFRRIHAPFGSLSEYRVPSEDGAAVFIFDARGVHKKSVNAITGVDELVFGYDASGRKLTSITDAFGNTTNIYRDSATAYRIRGPFGQETALTLEGGVLTRVVSPGGLRFAMEYTGAGASTSLLSAFWDPSGNVPDWKATEKAHRFTYDSLGHLVSDSNPTGGAKILSLTPRLDGFQTDVTTILGRKTTYVTRRFGGGLDGTERRVFSPTGTSSIEKSHQEPGFGSEWKAAMGPTGSAAASHTTPDPRFAQAKWADKVESYPWANVEFYRSGGWKAGDGTLTSVAAGAAKRPWFTMQHSRVFDPPSNPDPTTLQSLTETWSGTGTNGTSSWTLKTRKSTVTRLVGTPVQWKLEEESASGRKSTTILDAKGLVRRVQVLPLAAVEYDYDSAGRVQAMQQGTCPAFTTAITTEDCRRSTVTYVVSGPSAGTLLTSIDPLGRTVTYTRDAEGRPTTTVSPGTTATRTTSMRWTSAGDVDAITTPLHFGASPAKEHRFTWDVSGRPVTYDPPTATSNPGLTYGFNVDDQPTSIGGAFTASLTYDPKGVLTGQVAAVTNADGTALPTYADDDRLLRLLGPRGDTMAPTWDGPLLKAVAVGFGAPGATTIVTTLSPQWDERYLRPTAMVVTPQTGDTFSIGVTYDDEPAVVGGDRLTNKDGLPTSIGATRIKDGIPTAIGSMSLSRGAPERNDGAITETNLGSVKTQYAFNQYGELAGNMSGSAIATGGIDARFGASTNIYKAVHERDKIGRITALIEQVETGAPRRLEYDYWPSGWLKSVGLRNSDGSLSLKAQYTYDANGNRLSKTPGSGLPLTGVANDQDQLVSYAGETLVWTNGMLVQKGTASLTYDASGNLVRYVNGAATVDYLIDADGRRIGRKEGSGAWIHWVYAPGSLSPLAELDSTGAIRSLFVYGVHSNVPDYVVQDGVAFKVVVDHLGSVRRVVNVTSGAIVQKNDYDDDGFGSLNSATSWVASGFRRIPFGFAGGLQDDVTGLVHFGAREYLPAAGIWTSRDPQGLGGGLNTYAYVAQDPINSVDPEGEKERADQELMDDARYGIGKALGFDQFAHGQMDKVDGLLMMAKDETFNAGLQKYLKGVCQQGLGAIQAATTVGAVVAVAPTLASMPKSAVAWVTKGLRNRFQQGTYINKFASGKWYVGKGSRYRSQVSGRRITREFGDEHISTQWIPAKNGSHREAFKTESREMQNMSPQWGHQDPMSYNKAQSPGKKYRIEDGEP